MEFLNRQFQSYLTSQGIKHYNIWSVKKAAFAENGIKNLMNHLARYMTQYNTKNIGKILPAITKSINAAYNRSIRMAPSNVKPENSWQVWETLWGDYVKQKANYKPVLKFTVGDSVRLSTKRILFKKGTQCISCI